MNKNLKRVLSGAMASSMLVGMMATGASAAVADQFSDAEDIVNTNAVDTLVALNIINGKDDGTFDPTAVVTRASMAKMLTIALNGGKEPVLPTNATPTFSDIKGHWAESYIEYCTSLGIIAGRGDGTFDPDATVTGSEAAKMMLVAMGYPADIYGFTGSAWAINVGVEANKSKLYDGIESVDASAGLSRDNTAQLIYNGVLANTMTKTPQQVVGGDTTWVYNTTGASIFASKYNGKVFVGTMTGNDHMQSGLKDGAIQIKGWNEEDDKSTGAQTATFVYDFDISNIGEEVKVLYKDGNGGTANKPDDKDTIYGVFNTGKTNVIWTTRGDVGSVKSSDQKIKLDGTKYTVADNVEVIYNYDVDNADHYTGANAINGSDAATAMTVKGDDNGNGHNSGLTRDLQADNGGAIKAVCNSDGHIDAIYVVNSELSYVTAINDEKVSLKGVGTLTFEDHAIEEGLEKNDVVVITTLYKKNGKTDATKSGAFCIVEKAEVVSGTIDGYKKNESVTVDGETYTLHNDKLFDLAFDSDAWDGSDPANDVYDFNGKVGETFDLYLVNGYVAGAIQTSEDANNYSAIIAIDNGTNIGSTFNNVRIQVLTADGTKVILTPNEDSKKTDGTKVTASSDFSKGQIVTWTGDEDDATVQIEAASSMSVTNGYDEDTKSLDGKVVTSDAVLYFYKNSSTTGYKAYNLRELDDIAGTQIKSYVVVNDKIVAAYAEGASYPTGAKENTVYGIISSWANTVKIDGTYYNSYTVENDAETYTINLKLSDAVYATKGDVVSFKPVSDDLYGNGDIANLTKNATAGGGQVFVKEFDESDWTLTYYMNATKDANGVVTKTGLTTMALDEDCVISYVNHDDKCAGDEIGIGAFDEVTCKANAIIVKSSDGKKIIAIVVETSNTGF